MRELDILLQLREKSILARTGRFRLPRQGYFGGAEIEVPNGPNALSRRLDEMAAENKRREEEEKKQKKEEI